MSEIRDGSIPTAAEPLPDEPLLDDLWRGDSSAAAKRPAQTLQPPPPKDAPRKGKHSAGEVANAFKASKRDKSSRKPLKASKTAKKATAVGVILDGSVAYKAVVRSGSVTAFTVFEADNPTDALKQALKGTKDARVATLGGLLFKPEADIGQMRRGREALAIVAAGTAAWPASRLAGVAALRCPEPGKVVLAGIDGQVAADFWDELKAAKARLVPLPFVLSDGAWFAIGRESSWLIIVQDGLPRNYRELRMGSKALSQAAAAATFELSRLNQSGQVTYVAGVPMDAQTTEILARAGLRAQMPALRGVDRWEIPVVEQGAALLAVQTAVADVPSLGYYASPQALAKAAEAPIRQRRILAVSAVSLVAAAILASGIIPAISAHQQLATEEAVLKLAEKDKATVGRWITLSQQAASAEAALGQLRAANPAFSTAIQLLESTAPPGTQLATVTASPESQLNSSAHGGSSPTGVSMTVQANIIGADSFTSVASWQEELTRQGATVQVYSESLVRHIVSVSLTVTVPNGSWRS